MSIPALPGAARQVGVTHHTDPAVRQRIDRQPAPAAGTRPPITITNPLAESGAAHAVAGANVPAQPPPGTDPMLWSVLSAEERTFFARLGAMGPLTYGRILNEQQHTPAPAMRGGRLDLKI